MKKCGGVRVDELLGEKYKGQRGLLSGDDLGMIRRELGLVLLWQRGWKERSMKV